MNWEDSDSFDDEDDEPTVKCNDCGADVYEDAIQCPQCQNYITHDSSVWSDKSLTTKLVYKGIAIVLILTFLGIGLQQLLNWLAN